MIYLLSDFRVCIVPLPSLIVQAVLVKLLLALERAQLLGELGIAASSRFFQLLVLLHL